MKFEIPIKIKVEGGNAAIQRSQRNAKLAYDNGQISLGIRLANDSRRDVEILCGGKEFGFKLPGIFTPRF